MLSTSLTDIHFSYLDVETTGLDPYSGDRICEISIVKTRGKKVFDKFETLINPGRIIPTRAASIHRITDDMVMKAPFFRDIALNVRNILENSIIVAHNAKFDLEFLHLEFNNLKLVPPENKVVDTFGIAKRYYSFPSNSLVEIAKCLGISTLSNHRAFADVRITIQVFEYFLRDLKRGGMRIKSLKDVLKLSGSSVKIEGPKNLVIPPEIEEALRIKGRLKIRYLSAYSDTTTTRIIEPIEVNLSRRNTYVLAYCHLRKQRCNFRLDRILEVKYIT
ncbi:WYL domain-containing protein [Desulfobacterota bacterium AH_259_B03_O07]|nr:WYL domain-containing protein [Desulfobacterota bacterium AH_259_B03_O07]